MSYQDKATTQELAYLETFREYQAQIIAYRAAHGGDLEGAFQKVTGIPWPQNRSVKITNGSPEITADRTFKSVMGRYVAPIAGAAATAFGVPGLLPGLIGGGGSAAGGIAPGVIANSAPSIGGAVAPAAAKLTTAQIARDVLGMGAGMIGGAADDMAANRGNRAEFDLYNQGVEQDGENAYNDALIKREAAGRAARQSAWDIMNRAAYVGRADGSTPGFSPYSKPIMAPSAEQKAAAAGVEADARRALAAGNTLPMPQRIGGAQFADASGWENTANVAAPIAGVASRLPLSVWQKLGKFIR